MPKATAGSVFSCRILSLGLGAVGLGFGALAVVTTPPALSGWVLMNGNAGGPLAVTGFWILALGWLALALGALRAARTLWRRALRTSSRRVQLSALAGLLGLALAQGIGELGTRALLDPEEVLHGDAFWIERWRQALMHAPPQPGDGFKPGTPVDRFDSELGWVPSDLYRSAEINTNSRGARGAREDPIPKPAGERRVVVIGDSFTFGEGVRDDAAYPSLLEPLLPGSRVINLGVLGYGTDQQYLRLLRSGFDYGPDLIVLGFFGPNAERNVLGFRDYAKPRFRLDGEDLLLANSPLPDPAVPWPSPIPLVRSWSLAGRVGSQLLDRTRFAPKWALTRCILDAIREATQQRGIPLLVVHMPKKTWAFRSVAEDSEVFVEEWARDRGAPLVKIRDAFLKLPTARRRDVYHGHWTPFGNRIVAGAIARGIQAMGLLAR